MAQTYTVARLSTDKVDQAFPLMHALEPQLDIDQWRRISRSTREAQAAGSDAETILVVAGPRGYLLGVCVVAFVGKNSGDSRATVSRCMIDSVLDPEGVASALLQTLVELSERAGCTRLRISIMGTDETALAALARARATLPPLSLTIEMT